MTLATENQISAPISMTIRKGDRISVGYDSKNIASTIFYALNPQIISCNNVFVNGNEPLSNFNLAIYYLHSAPLAPFRGSVLSMCRFIRPDLMAAELQTKLSTFFQQVGIP